MTNNVDGTLFDLMNQPIPAGGTFQFNNIATVGTTNTYNSTWTARDVPPGYLATVDSGGANCSDRIFADGFDGDTPPCPGGRAFVDITGTGTAQGLGDDDTVAVTMPFSFSFYGITSNQVCITNNGYMLFGSTFCPTFGAFSNVALPSIEFSAPAIMPLWDDFASQSGDVYTDVRGTTPNRQFIVEWFDRVHYNGSVNTDGATFEVILNEDGTLEFEYADVTYSAFSSGDPDDCSNGVCATIGLQSDMTLFNEFSAFQASITDESRIKWTATNPQVFTSSDSVTVNVGAPQIVVNPATLTGSGPAGTGTTIPFLIENHGDRDLIWTTDEALPANFHMPFGARYAPSTVLPGETDLSKVRPSAGWRQARDSQGKPDRTSHRPVNPHIVGTPSFGCSSTSPSSCEYVTFDADAPQTLSTVANQNEPTFFGSFVSNGFGKEYVIGYPSGDLEIIDTVTGARTDIGPTGFGEATRDIAWDETTGTLFGTAIDGSGTDLFTVDLDTGNMTLIAPISGLGPQAYVMGLAVDPNSGLMYGIEIATSSLVAIDKSNGNAAVVGSLGYTTRYAQGLDFNAATGTLYLASIDYSAGTQNMYKVDTTTGIATLIAPIGSNVVQLGAFAIAIPSGPCAQPQDLPWLSLSAQGGTTLGGGSSPVTAAIDGTGTQPGDVLSGTVCVTSNDSHKHVVAVPIDYTAL